MGCTFFGCGFGWGGCDGPYGFDGAWIAQNGDEERTIFGEQVATDGLYGFL